jgi:DNA-binding response OmpR family regulator
MSRILVVDDERKIRDLYRRQLKEEGFEVAVAEDGESALEFLENNKDIDLIILDLLMPGIDGSDLFEAIKEKFPQIKVIIASSCSEDDQRYTIFDADDYYCKSDSISFFIKKIRKVLKSA